MARRSKAKKRPASKAKKRSAATTNRANSVARPEKLVRAFAAEAMEDMELAWGKKVSPAFKRRVIEISAELGIDPNNLMAAMAFESARTFRADIENPFSGAAGLIQFMPATAKRLGTSTAALKRMTPVAQLEFADAIFCRRRAGSMTSTMCTWQSCGRALSAGRRPMSCLSTDRGNTARTRGWT